MTCPADPSRRDLLLTPLLAALPLALAGRPAQAAIDPSITIIQQADQIPWEVALDRPRNIVEYAFLWGNPSQPGPYLSLVRWHPGFMSAPHWYETERHCMVVSGTWWVGSGERFDPATTIPVPAGGSVRRVARMPHYDGVLKQAAEPTVVAICGIGPITFHKTDPDQPSWRTL
jgi:hypothetical protein